MCESSILCPVSVNVPGFGESLVSVLAIPTADIDAQAAKAVELLKAAALSRLEFISLEPAEVPVVLQVIRSSIAVSDYLEFLERAAWAYKLLGGDDSKKCLLGILSETIPGMKAERNFGSVIQIITGRPVVREIDFLSRWTDKK